LLFRPGSRGNYESFALQRFYFSWRKPPNMISAERPSTLIFFVVYFFLTFSSKEEKLIVTPSEF
jgi:hypothetical protein